MTLGQDTPDWRWVALQLGTAVEALLAEFAEMCRGADCNEQAGFALRELTSALVMEQAFDGWGVTPPPTPTPERSGGGSMCRQVQTFPLSTSKGHSL